MNTANFRSFISHGSLLCLLALLSSCGIYRNRIMFQTEKEFTPATIQLAVEEAKNNYTLQPNDFIEVEVYTNEGELIIDPNNEIMREIGAGMNMQQMNRRQTPQFLVREDGLVKLPMLGDVQVLGLTLNETETMLQEQYAAFYEDVFVIVRYNNKRVIVLGATGGQVIPLVNENTHLIEVLALAGGVSTQARTDNIRLIRGNLNDPEVRIINLSTIEGMKDASLKIIPGDIIYVQPVQRIANEAVRDISPIFSLITSVLTLILLVDRFGS
ncbi:MAG: polysaccharide biosynthesis/export family protein [Cyclobacteriaceae bacterium]